MNLLDFVKLDELQNMQDLFASATGLAAAIVDREGNFVTQPSNYTDFCMNYTRQSSLGAKRCARCDAEGKGAYFCHAGLMEFSEPIMVEEEHLGNIIGGQALTSEPDIAKFEQMAEELDLSKEEYIEALGKVTVRSEESIRAAASLLQEMVNMLVNSHYALEKEKEKLSVLSEKVADVIDDSQQIVTKAASLEKISYKQNILSLNASIESARAGDAGRGFAIVAKQIGELTRDSSEIYSSIMKDADAIRVSATKLDEIFKS